MVLPGSKSITARALVLAVLAESHGRVVAPLRARDTDLMVAGLTAMGASVNLADDGAWDVLPSVLTGCATVDAGLAGTVARFLPPVATLAEGPVTFDGDPRARQRPLRPLTRALRDLGAAIDADELPLTVRGTGALRGGMVVVDASASSQFVSALLMVGPRADRGIGVRHVGASLPSMPHIAMTVQMLRDAGALVDNSEPALWRVSPGALLGRAVTVEPDLSNAAPFLAAALVTGGTVRVPGWPTRTTQPGDALRHLLAQMGAAVELDGGGLTVRGGGAIAAVDLDLHDVGELTPVLTALAALADGPSRFRGIGHLRGHESDRLAALATEVNRLGGDVEETEDGLVVRPRPLSPGVVQTYDDHRIATAGAVLGLAVEGVQVADVATTRKTMPDFVGLWSQMLAS